MVERVGRRGSWGVDTWVQLIVVLLFDEKVSFKACRFESGEFYRNYAVCFAPSPQQRMDKPRGIFPGNLPRLVDARKLGSIFILRDLERTVPSQTCKK